MSIAAARRWALVVLVLTLGTGHPARAQAIDPAIYIDFDTSGSMLMSPAGNAICYGDGSVEHPHWGGCVSRMYMAKNALYTAISGYPEVQWGLARFKQQVGFQIACVCGSVPPPPYPNPGSFQSDVAPSEEPDSCEPWTTYHSYDQPGLIDPLCINYVGGFASTSCPGGVNCCDPGTTSVDLEGADILVALAPDNDARILTWLDHAETDFHAGVEPGTGDHCWSGSDFGDCELRAMGGTPIAGSLRDLYAQLSLVDLGNDDERACRTHAVILLTDGDESCASNQNQAASAAAALLSTPDLQHDCTGCPVGWACSAGRCIYEVKTHVIAFGLADLTNANAIAAAGGTGTAIPASNEEDITAAIAQIASESVKSELCNGQDDNCDGQIDEGFPVGQTCDNGGLGVCYATGTYLCDAGDPTRVTCQLTSTPPAPGSLPEICDGQDNDCDGEVDEDNVCVCNGPELCNGVDDYCDNWFAHAEGSEDSRVGQPCGSDVGACTAGLTQCGAGGTITCSGTTPTAEVCDANVPENDQNCNGVSNDGVAPLPCTNTVGSDTCSGLQTCNVDGTWTCWAPTPAAEACNNVDDNCNGQVDENLSRACQVTNASGTCFGTQSCSLGAWSACNAATPNPETCNGADDNCNGQVDENLSRACQVTNGNGTCAGVEFCTGGTYAGCTAATPNPEICNNLDDDCNGQIDDGLARSCYTGPAGTVGQGICHAGSQTCTTGTWSGCVGEQVPQAEVCDNVDNDCDGQTDEGLGNTTCGLGLCEHTVANCVGGVAQTCNPFLGAQPEVCDSVDNDCDGVVDGLTEACYPSATTGCTETSPGVWSCQGACRTGQRTCPIGGGGWGACTLAATPQAEVCDGVDNDCDGQTDEDALGNPIAQVCYSPGSGANTGCTYDAGNQTWTCQGECQTGLRSCVGGLLGPCQNEAVPALEVCDGLDNDCDGQIDEPEDIPGLGESCGTALGRCTPGIFVCDNGVPDCVGGEGPFPGLCNGEDDDCDGQIDEADEVAGDPLVGQPCGDATGLCEAGTTVCLGGQVLCGGGTGPSEEVCDGADNDCDGEIDEAVDCPTVNNIDTHCVDGACRPECDPSSEFPCPGSLQCQESLVDGQTVYVCLPPVDPCAGQCQEGEICENGQCVDPCDPNPCQWWEECHTGTCVDTTCSGPGGHCPAGEFCQDHACVADPCREANCAALGGFCLRDCDASGCSARCEPVCSCPVGERCRPDGGCAAETCLEGCGAGERCNLETATCEADPCAAQLCPFGERCFEGDCLADPCAFVTCPPFYQCELMAVSNGLGGYDPAPICRADGRWWVEGTGVEEHTYTARGRGGCQTAGEAPPPGGLLLLMLLGVLRWARRRRQGGVR